MVTSLALLLACFWLLGRVLRGALVSLMARWLRQGRDAIPLAFTLRPVPIPGGETLAFASRASLWQPAAAPAPGSSTLRIGRRHTVSVTGRRLRHAIAGHARAAGGLLVVTDRRVLFRGRGAGGDVREDVPLGDVAHLRVEGPLLTVERRSQPARPLVVRIATPAPVATLVASAAAGAAARAAARAPARATR
jgi:hypothetical protein